jgi:hypothetical protein
LRPDFRRSLHSWKGLMPRFHLRALMIAVLAAAIALGIGMALKRRSGHYQQLYLAQTLEASRLVDEMHSARGKASIARLMRRAHWHNLVGAEYHSIASCPWQLDRSDPASLACPCSKCGGRYPGGVVDDDWPIDFASP